jgi:hypothetical protein
MDGGLTAASVISPLHHLRTADFLSSRLGPPQVSRVWGSKYERLARISMAHIYNLRKSGTYRKRPDSYQPTRPTNVSVGGDANRTRRAGRDTCEWTRYIRVTWTESTACITSMQSMR